MKRNLTLLAAASLVSLLAAAPAGAAPTPPRCDEGRWPASVQGQPRSFQVGGPAGYSVWHDGSGWHLRTTTPSSEGHAFTGRITASHDVKLVHVYKNEPADSVKVDGRTIIFRFDTHAHVDGIDFTVGCTNRVRFALSGEGRAWPAKRIWVGATGHAPSNPFTVSRRPA